MTDTPAKTNETENAVKHRRQVFVGKVTSAKMKDTAVVVVERYVKHRKYGKFMKKQTKIMAHDPGNTKKEGEQATVEACAPISKRKTFKVVA